MKIGWRYLLIPLFSLLALFIADKVFLIPEVRDSFLQPGGMVYYRQRLHQIQKFRDYAKKKPDDIKLAVVLGDSRAFALGNLPAHTIGRKDWRIYNFAGPQASPAYFYYLAEKLFVPDAKPGYLILEVSPEAFNRNSGILGSTVLNHGTTGDYVDSVRTMIPDSDYDAYMDTRRFALYGLPFSIREFYLRVRGSLFPRKIKTPFDGIPFEQLVAGYQQRHGSAIEWQQGLMKSMANAQKHNLDLYRIEASHEVQLLDMMSGGQYAWYGTATDARLRADTDRIAGIYLKRFQVSEEQVHFFLATLDRAQAEGIRTLVYWPQVNPHLEKILDADERIAILKKRLTREAEDRGARVLDLAQEKQTRCASFYDASHLSIQCFPAITGFLLDQFK